MTRLEALEELAKKVEAGTVSGSDYGCILDDWPKDAAVRMDADGAFKGSLDAAKALHEAVLPEFKYMDLLRRGSRYTARISRSVDSMTNEVFEAVSFSSLSRALLLADIRALIAQEESA